MNIMLKVFFSVDCDYINVVGDLVIVKYICDDDWYRVRVKQVIGKSNVNKMELEVFYIDYGNLEIVGLDR